jgi:6-pyruvoyltetrahydropterin/6-carboxytetrahydropterin synthase
MYYLQKTVTISAANSLDLEYESPCKNLHGHNWKITVFIKGERLSKEGMLIDFKTIKNIIMELDHANLNDVIKMNPTAEHIAYWIHLKINDFLEHHPIIFEPSRCYKVTVQETEGNEVSYEDSL